MRKYTVSYIYRQNAIENRSLGSSNTFIRSQKSPLQTYSVFRYMLNSANIGLVSMSSLQEIYDPSTNQAPIKPVICMQYAFVYRPTATLRTVHITVLYKPILGYELYELYVGLYTLHSLN